MSLHEISVTMEVEVTFTIDDEKASDWDGRSLMTVHENPERWAAEAPIERDLALSYMASQIIDRGRLGGTDGWADFPDDATSFSWPRFYADEATVNVREVSA